MELEEAIGTFGKAIVQRGKERGSNRARKMERDEAMQKLRYMTSYFRRIGRAALMQDAARADFDRVARVARVKKAAPAAVEQEAA